MSAVGVFALMAPDVTAFSVFLVIPFLLLFPAPTLSIYLLSFTLPYLGLRRRNRVVSVASGLAVVAAVGLGVPSLIDGRIAAERRQLLSGDTPPAQPLDPAGAVVGLVSQAKKGQPACGDLCLALLYSGKAAAVVDTSDYGSFSRGRPLVGWRIERRERPCQPVKPEWSEQTRWQGFVHADVVAGRALTGECVVAVGVSPSSVSFVLAHEYPASSAERLSLWRFTHAGAPRLLARRTWHAPEDLVRPLFLVIDGSPNSHAYWSWARVRGSPRLPAEAGEFLGVDPDKIAAATPAALRAALDSWLDDPKAEDGALANQIGLAVLPVMTGDTREPSDFARFLRLIADPRRDVDDAEKAAAAFPERASEIGDAALARLATLPPDSPAALRMNDVVEGLPAGTFAKSMPALVGLLRYGDRRRTAPALVARLADAGPAAAPLLLDLFRSAARGEGRTGDFDGDTLNAALDGLCRLGPRIAPAYRAVEEEVRLHRSVEDALANDPLWAATRIRLGRARQAVAPPPDATRNWFDQVERRLRQADCSP